MANYDFVGFVEGGDIPGDRTDVIVTDGFTGNVALKTGEGLQSSSESFYEKPLNTPPLSARPIAGDYIARSSQKTHRP